MIRRSRECVINLQMTTLTEQVVSIVNSSGTEVDKFESFGLTTQPAKRVGAPLIGECHAHCECRLFGDSLVERYNFFIWEVVSARSAVSPEYPETLHYIGDGVFMAAGEIIVRREQFLPKIL